MNTPTKDADSAAPKGGLSTTLKVGLAGAAVLLAVAAVVFFRPSVGGDPALVKLEALIQAANTACVSNSEVENAAKVGTELNLLVDKIKGEGGITEYRKKHIGADKTLPAELQPPENEKIRQCMSTYMPGIFKAIGIEMPPQQDSAAKVPNPLQLRFSYLTPSQAKVAVYDTLRINLQTPRRVFDSEKLARQDAGHYSYNTAYPGDGEEVHGTLVRDLAATSQDAPPAPTKFCLRRPAPLQPSDDNYMHLDCTEAASCTLHDPSPKWLEVCVAAPKKTASRGFGWLPEAVAAEAPRRWSVPSAQTLAAHKERLSGVGYTLFSVETDAFRDPAVIGVEVGIRVNGLQVDEDGLTPELRPVPNVAGKPFTHRFALESLDFEGAHAGCEAIVLTLTPRLAGGKTGEPLVATLPYVALRDKAKEAVPLGGKGTLAWEARYVIPPDEWSHEAFITSVTYSTAGGDEVAAAAREKAGALKAAFDKFELSYKGRPLVAVIRPPLTQTGTQLSYGLAAGVVQPSGQVRFTFSNADASAIGKALLDARAATPGAQRVIDRKEYIYKAAGNPARQGTPTPPGVCRHVKAA